MALTVISSNGGREGGWLALNIKLLGHTHIRSRGRGLLGTTGSIAGNKSQLGVTLIGIAHQVSADTAV